MPEIMDPDDFEVLINTDYSVSSAIEFTLPVLEVLLDTTREQAAQLEMLIDKLNGQL